MRVDAAELNAAFLNAADSMRAAGFAEGLAHRDKPPHYQPTLNADERAHYAWLRGDYTLQEVIDEVEIHVDPDLVEALQDRGIYSEKDLSAIVKEHEETQGFLEDAEAQRDGAIEVLSSLVEHLTERTKPLGIRRGKALAQVLQALIDDKGADRFSYASRQTLMEALCDD